MNDGILALTRPGSPEWSQLGSLNKPKNIRTWGHSELGRHQECGEKRQSGGGLGERLESLSASSSEVSQQAGGRQQDGEVGAALCLATQGSHRPSSYEAP